MPLAGHLKDFPLPEVLLFVGLRTGSLRIFDLPDTAAMKLELSKGYAHALYLGDICLDEDREIVTQLSLIVAKGEGTFEFMDEPEISTPRQYPLPVNNLVILMVVYVDEVLNKKSESLGREPIYKLQSPQPTIGIDSNLSAFFQQCQPLLNKGARMEQMAALVGMKNEDVLLNLAYLRQLGFVETLDPSEFIDEIHLEQKITQKSAEFQIAAEASDLILRTGKLFKITSS